MYTVRQYKLCQTIYNIVDIPLEFLIVLDHQGQYC